MQPTTRNEWERGRSIYIYLYTFCLLDANSLSPAKHHSIAQSHVPACMFSHLLPFVERSLRNESECILMCGRQHRRERPRSRVHGSSRTFARFEFTISASRSATSYPPKEVKHFRIENFIEREEECVIEYARSYLTFSFPLFFLGQDDFENPKSPILKRKRNKDIKSSQGVLRAPFISFFFFFYREPQQYLYSASIANVRL